jgi:hypothetical protein
MAAADGNPSLPNDGSYVAIEGEQYDASEPARKHEEPATQNNWEDDQKRFENPEEYLTWPTEINDQADFQNHSAQEIGVKASKEEPKEAPKKEAEKVEAPAKPVEAKQMEKIEDPISATDYDERREAINRELNLKANRAGRLATRLVKANMVKEEDILVVARALETMDSDAQRNFLVAMDNMDVAMGTDAVYQKIQNDAEKHVEKMDEMGTNVASKDKKAEDEEAPVEEEVAEEEVAEEEVAEEEAAEEAEDVVEEETPDPMVQDVVEQAVPEVVEQATEQVIEESKDELVEGVVDQLTEDFLETTDGEEEEELDLSDDPEVPDFDLDADAMADFAVFDGAPKTAEEKTADKKGPAKLSGNVKVASSSKEGGSFFEGLGVPKIKL